MGDTEIAQGYSPIFYPAKERTLPKLTDKFNSIYELFADKAAEIPSAPFLGQRKRLGKEKHGKYSFINFKEGLDYINVLARGVRALNLDPIVENSSTHSIRPIALQTKNCLDRLCFDIACSKLGATIIPLYETFGEDAIALILEETGPQTLFVDIPSAQAFLKRKNKGCIRTIITCNYLLFEEELRAIDSEARRSNIKMIKLEDVCKAGSTYPEIEPANNVQHPNLICYTSGTTGLPKGVLLTEFNIISLIDQFKTDIVGTPEKGVRFFSYLTTAHVFGRTAELCYSVMGMSIGFSSGNVLNMLEDLADLKPHHMIAVPRIIYRLVSRVIETVEKGNCLKRFLFNTALSYKLFKFKRTGCYVCPVFDSVVFKKVREVLGGKVKFLVCGAAPIHPDMQKKFQVLFSTQVIQGYGLSETTGGVTIQQRKDPAGYIGKPMSLSLFKMKDIPELGYTYKGNRCGEALIKGATVFSEYYCRPKETEECFDDGWFCSGDVVKYDPKYGFSIVDRKKYIFKLSQGEYVAPEKIEIVLSTVPYIDQIFVYGDSYRSKLVALITINEEVVEERCKVTPAEAYKSPIVHDAIMKELTRASNEQGLKGFERVYMFTLIQEKFSTQNSMLGETLKPRRHQIQKVHKSEIEEMYKKLKDD